MYDTRRSEGNLAILQTRGAFAEPTGSQPLPGDEWYAF